MARKSNSGPYNILAGLCYLWFIFVFAVLPFTYECSQYEMFESSGMDYSLVIGRDKTPFCMIYPFMNAVMFAGFPGFILFFSYYNRSIRSDLISPKSIHFYRKKKRKKKK